MTKPSTVYELVVEADEHYPRLNFAHPRNRDVDWDDIRRKIDAPDPPPGPLHDFFLKTARDIDMANLSGLGFLVSPRLRDVLIGVAGDTVAFAPFAVNGKPFWLLRSLLEVDALDLERSDFTGAPPDRIRLINVPVWRGEQLSDPMLFRIPNVRNTIWVTDGVRRAYEESGYGGFSFMSPGEVL